MCEICKIHNALVNTLIKNKLCKLTTDSDGDKGAFFEDTEKADVAVHALGSVLFDMIDQHPNGEAILLHIHGYILRRIYQKSGEIPPEETNENNIFGMTKH